MFRQSLLSSVFDITHMESESPALPKKSVSKFRDAR